MQVKREHDNKAVHINVDMEKLLDRIKAQNFVPVVDDDKIFIGIVTRKDVVQFLADELARQRNGKL